MTKQLHNVCCASLASISFIVFLISGSFGTWYGLEYKKVCDEYIKTEALILSVSSTLQPQFVYRCTLGLEYTVNKTSITTSLILDDVVTPPTRGHWIVIFYSPQAIRVPTIKECGPSTYFHDQMILCAVMSGIGLVFSTCILFYKCCCSTKKDIYVSIYDN